MIFDATFERLAIINFIILLSTYNFVDVVILCELIDSRRAIVVYFL